MAVMTINGVIPKTALGPTTPHEHIFIDIRNQYPGDCSEGSLGFSEQVSQALLPLLLEDPYALRDNLVLDDEELAFAELSYAKGAGMQTLVDVTLPDIGRDVAMLRRMADRLDIYLVASTGYYTADTHPASLAFMSAEDIAAQMVTELMVGMDGTTSRAGIIGELGTSSQLLPEEAEVLKAAAIAHKATGAPVMVHLYPWGKVGHQVLDILMKNEVSPERICLCHTDVLLDRAEMKSLLTRGVYLEFDNFGKEFQTNTPSGGFPTDAKRVDTLLYLAEAGYEKQILISCDICLKNLYHRFGGKGYDHIFTTIPLMIEERYPNSHSLLNLLQVENPARYLDNPKLDCELA